MTTVKILDSYVGSWEPGQIVRDAPPELVSLAERQVRNAATGNPVAQIVEDGDGAQDISRLQAELDASRKREDVLKVELEDSKKREADLRAQLDELTKPPAGKTGDDLDELRAQAKELKVPGYTKMGADELRAAIDAAGGEEDAK